VGDTKREALANGWRERAEALGARGHFRLYTIRQREEVLRKGYLGRYRPDAALVLAQRGNSEGRALRTPKYNDEMREWLQAVGPEVRERTQELLAEIPATSYEPPAQLNEPPGLPSVFSSRLAGWIVYFKFQILGSAQKPQVLFWSCHPALENDRGGACNS